MFRSPFLEFSQMNTFFFISWGENGTEMGLYSFFDQPPRLTRGVSGRDQLQVRSGRWAQSCLCNFPWIGWKGLVRLLVFFTLKFQNWLQVLTRFVHTVNPFPTHGRTSLLHFITWRISWTCGDSSATNLIIVNNLSMSVHHVTISKLEASQGPGVGECV